MVEIYSYDISAHDAYAQQQQAAAKFFERYHIRPAQAKQIAAQTAIHWLVPQHTAVVLLLNTDQKITWGGYGIPPGYFEQHLSSPYVLGPPETQAAELDKIQAVSRQANVTEEQKEQAELLSSVIKDTRQTNLLTEEVIGRKNQFVQA